MYLDAGMTGSWEGRHRRLIYASATGMGVLGLPAATRYVDRSTTAPGLLALRWSGIAALLFGACAVGRNGRRRPLPMTNGRIVGSAGWSVDSSCWSTWSAAR